MSDRTFKLDNKLMEGGDVKEWQELLKKEFKHLNIDHAPIKVDGVYGPGTRSLSASFFKAAGLSPNLVKNGITPGIRRKIRERRFTAAEEKRRHSKAVKEYRDDLNRRWKPERAKVHTPVTHVLTDSWGYHPPVHDGLDVGCPANAVIFAMVKSKVIDVRSSGWWGKAPSGQVSLGDGIIQLEVLESVGPFKKGQHIGYGHAEKANVKVGQVVEAGHPIGHAGKAVVWHIHLMVNNGKVGNRGIGNVNPEPHYRYAVRND